MNSNGCNTRVLRDARDAHTVALFGGPARTNLHRHRDGYRSNRGAEYARDQRFVAKKCRARRLIAHLLRRTSHVDVNDVGAGIRFASRGLCDPQWIGACDLHHARANPNELLTPQSRRSCIPKLRVRARHFGNDKTRT